MRAQPGSLLSVSSFFFLAAILVYPSSSFAFRNLISLSFPLLVGIVSYLRLKYTHINMRYGNWDVLLFPHGSKTPMQEFRTQCFVTRDNGTKDCADLDTVY